MRLMGTPSACIIVFVMAACQAKIQTWTIRPEGTLTTERITIDIPTCARLLGISLGTAYTLAAEGKLPTIRLGRRLVVPKAALEKMLADVGHASGP